MNTRILFAIVLSAPLALAMGCGVVDDYDQDEANNRLAACQHAGGIDCDNDGVPDNPDRPGGVGTIRSGLVVARAPNDLEGQPFVGDFYFGNPEKVARWWRYSCHEDEDKSCEGEEEDPRTLACQDANSCEVEAEGEVTIEFRCPKHLFLPRTVSGNPDAPTSVSWNAPGDWGLAPNGTYYHEEAQHEADVKTYIAQGQILLRDDGDIVGAVTGSSFAWTTEGGTIYSNGSISDDLGTISYHMVTASGNEYDWTLTLVE